MNKNRYVTRKQHTHLNQNPNYDIQFFKVLMQRQLDIYRHTHTAARTPTNTHTQRTPTAQTHPLTCSSTHTQTCAYTQAHTHAKSHGGGSEYGVELSLRKEVGLGSFFER